MAAGCSWTDSRLEVDRSPSWMPTAAATSTLLLEGMFGPVPGVGKTTMYDIATGDATTVLDMDIPSWQRLAR